jgi:hypothetical protein
MVSRSFAKFCFILQVVFIVVAVFAIIFYRSIDDSLFLWTVLLSLLITFMTVPIYMDNYIMRKNLNIGLGRKLLYFQIGLYLFAAAMIPLIEYVDSGSDMMMFLFIFVLLTVAGTVSTTSIVFFFRQQNKKRASLIIGFIMSLVSLGMVLLFWFGLFMLSTGLASI